MSVLFRIALRNLWQHKGKTLIIGILIGLGVVILVVGNSMMDTARRGIQRAFIDNYTANVMISGTAEAPISLFGVQSVGGIDPTPVLPDFPRIVEQIDRTEYVTAWTSQVTGFALLRPEDDRIEGLEYAVISVLFGAEPESYQEMFENTQLIEGRYLEPGEEGIMVTTDRLEELQEEAIEALEEIGEEVDEYPISVGDNIRVVGLTADGLPRIRVVPLVGVYEITGISEGVGFEFVSYIDPQTLRAILRLNLGASAAIALDASQTELLDQSADDNVFDADSLFSDDASDVEEEEAERDAVDFDDLDSILGTSAAEAEEDAQQAADIATTEPESEELESSTWHYILARVEPPVRTDEVVAELNDFFEENGIDAQAGNWEIAAGPFATSADVIRTVFNVAIIVIGVVAIIIMTNTLVISVMERTSEIGTMRALGASRSFVWRMFLYEVLSITAVFGTLGVLVSLATIGILNAIGIEATNTFLTVLFAGRVLRPVISIASIVGALIIVTIVGFLAHLYPVVVALRVQPIKAIRTE
ncbi:MAG: ABC transporter permease [Spirochaetales bacterium]